MLFCSLWGQTTAIAGTIQFLQQIIIKIVVEVEIEVEIEIKKKKRSEKETGES